MQIRLLGLTLRLVTAGAMKSPGAPPTRTVVGWRLWLPAGSVTAAGARSVTVPASPFSQGIDDESVTDEPSGATATPPSGRSLPAMTSVKSSTWTVAGSSGSLGCTRTSLSEVATPPSSAGDAVSKGVVAVANSDVLPALSVTVALS